MGSCTILLNLEKEPVLNPKESQLNLGICVDFNPQLNLGVCVDFNPPFAGLRKFANWYGVVRTSNFGREMNRLWGPRPVSAFRGKPPANSKIISWA